jgi:hypothetical protein
MECTLVCPLNVEDAEQSSHFLEDVCLLKCVFSFSSSNGCAIGVIPFHKDLFQNWPVVTNRAVFAEAMVMLVSLFV